MICFDLLPIEIIEKISLDSDLDGVDIAHMSGCCRRLCDIANQDKVWRQKYLKKWNRFVELRGTFFPWKEAYIYRCSIPKRLIQWINDIMKVGYVLDDLPDIYYNTIEQMAAECPQGFSVVGDELRHLYRSQNFTIQYYIEKCLNHLCQVQDADAWASFLSSSDEEQTLEQGAILVARWFQPFESVEETSILASLDHLAEEALQRTLEENRDFACRALLNGLQQDCITESRWAPNECRKLLIHLNYVLYERHQFRGNSEDYYSRHNSYLDKVLSSKRGIPISLCVLYSSVARRLGVVCEPIGFPCHLLLRWKANSHEPSPHQFLYIDAFNAGRFLTYEQTRTVLCEYNWHPNMNPNPACYSSISVKRVVERMIRNLIHIEQNQEEHNDTKLNQVRRAAKLMSIVSPEDAENLILLSRIYLHLGINHEAVIECMQRVIGADHGLSRIAEGLLREADSRRAQPLDLSVEVKQRTEDVLFAVGMVMRHKKYNYICVIRGWDKTCEASNNWMEQMGIDGLENKDQQPFYYVLADDGNNYYAAQENLQLASKPAQMGHPDIGKYFESFNGLFYIINRACREEYPDDIAVTQTLLSMLGTESAEEAPTPPAEDANV